MYILQYRNVCSGDWKQYNINYEDLQVAILEQKRRQRLNDKRWKSAGCSYIFRVIDEIGDVVSEGLPFFGGTHKYYAGMAIGEYFSAMITGADDWVLPDNPMSDEDILLAWRKSG